MIENRTPLSWLKKWSKLAALSCAVCFGAVACTPKQPSDNPPPSTPPATVAPTETSPAPTAVSDNTQDVATEPTQVNKPRPDGAIHSENHPDFQANDDAFRPVNGDPNDPRFLRQHGEFAKALKILNERQQKEPSAEQAVEILSIIEDTGNALEQVAQARQFAKQYPQDDAIRWSLAKGLLFAAATYHLVPERKKDVEAWMHEAATLIQQLEKSKFVAPEVPGYLAILKAELAFLRGQWAEAEKYCKEGLRLGTTAGETGDLYSMLFDIAVRQGKRQEASQYLDQALQVVAQSSANSYYGLRMFREEVLIVKEFVLDKPFVTTDLDKLLAIHNDLLQCGFVDPTSPNDSEAIELHKALRVYVTKRDAGDYAACLKIIQSFIDNKPNHTPRCFFSEGVSAPLRPYYLNMIAGKLCLKMNDKKSALTYFQEAAKAHPQDKLVEEQIKLAES